MKILALLLLLALSCSTPVEATYRMTWRLKDDRTCPTMKHVILHFTDYPVYSYGICSDDLARYLESYGPRPLEVVFAIYDPKAQLGGGDPTRIGELTKWTQEFSHMGSFQRRASSVPPVHPWSAVQTSK